MKTIHIIIILVVVVIVAIVITTLSNASTYSTFSEAGHKPGKEVQIMGKLDKTKPMEYDARKNANRFSFYLIDRKGTEKKVVYSNAKPQGFETADTIVIIGFMNKEEFNARQLLQKCPSKYDTKKVSEKFGVQKY